MTSPDAEFDVVSDAGKSSKQFNDCHDEPAAGTDDISLFIVGAALLRRRPTAN